MTRQDSSPQPDRALRRARSRQGRLAPRKRGGLKAILDRRCARRDAMLQAGAEKRLSDRTEKHGRRIRGHQTMDMVGLGRLSIGDKSMSDAPTPQIADLVDQYARSIDDADTVLAERIWLTSNAVSFIHPRGHERGWEEVKQNFYEKTMGARFSKRKLTTRDIDIRRFGDAAIVEFYWQFDAVFSDDGTPHRTTGRESQMVVNVPDLGWRIVQVHYSKMPVTGDREGF